jgi:hypothetical protein
MISSFDIRFLLINGSKTAVNNVMDERHTRLTETVDNLIERKNKIQCPPTNAPVKISLKNVPLLTLKVVLLKLKYRNKVTDAMSTRYHTNGTAEIEISLPKMPVKPQIKTVKWRIIRFLFSWAGTSFFAIILALLQVNNSRAQRIKGLA